MKNNLYKVVLVLTVCVMLGAISTTQQANAEILYTITDLGPGVAYDINNLGQVVGENFYWDSSTGRLDIANFVSINDSGLAITESQIWDSSSKQWGDTFPIRGNAINNSNQVAGHDGERPCMWDSVNGMQCVSEINGHAEDINDSGQMVGHGGGTDQIAWLWDASSGFQPLGVLNDGDSSAANAINNLSQVVGNSEFSAATEQHHAFLWDEVNEMQDLGTLGYRPPLIDSSVAYDINILGQVVGGSNASSSSEGVGGWLGFVWDNTHGMRDLNLLIPFGSGWTLGRAWAINDQGQIVGEGKMEGEEVIHAFLLTPLPSPIPQIVVSPINYNFEKVVVEYSSDPLVISIYNYGDVDLVVSDISLSDGINFILDGDTTATIESGGTHFVYVIFGPQSMGQHNAILSITSNDPNRPNAEVQLIGEGEAALWGCINYKGSPLGSVEVVLMEKGGKNQTAITDPDGCYRFEKVEDKGCKMKFDFPATSP